MGCDEERSAPIKCLLIDFAWADIAGKLLVPLGKDHTLSLLLHQHCLNCIGHTQVIFLTWTQIVCWSSKWVPRTTLSLTAFETWRCADAQIGRLVSPDRCLLLGYSLIIKPFYNRSSCWSESGVWMAHIRIIISLYRLVCSLSSLFPNRIDLSLEFYIWVWRCDHSGHLGISIKPLILRCIISVETWFEL